MLHDKKRDLDSEKQKRLLERMIAEVSRSHADLYYQPTAEIARHIRKYIDDTAELNANERELLANLSVHDIRVLLSLH
ncbi:MAG: hypothetical protein AAF557_13075 [Pseudomonadota bacterium]